MGKKEADPLIGYTIFDKYEILEVLGEGGVGVVYKANQIHIDRVVAVKTLKIQDPLLKQQFDIEVRVCSKLHHQNIVIAFDTCMTDEGQPFFIMDYLDGVSLKELLKIKKVLSLAEVDDIFLQICDAMDYSHRQGITHRDLKPGNVMLIPGDDGHFEVKLVDFGLAQVARESETAFLGGIMGSPLYMSPEQCKGARLDSRTDMYSIGVMLFESLTGDIPFLGESAEETMEMHEMSTPPRFAEIKPDIEVPEAIETIVMKLLEKKPDDRYDTMFDVKEAIRLKNPVGAANKVTKSQSMGWKSGSSHRSRPATASHRKPPPEAIPKKLLRTAPPPGPIGRRELIGIGAAIVFAVVTLGIFLFTTRQSPPPTQPDIAQPAGQAPEASGTTPARASMAKHAPAPQEKNDTSEE